MYDVVKVGKEELMGEVIKIQGENVIIQVYEDTSGIRPGEPVSNTGLSLAVELGPGLLTSIYDGIQRPLSVLVDKMGNFIERGVSAPGLSHEKKWTFKPIAKVGQTVNVRKPNKYYVSDGASINIQDTSEEYVAVTLDHQFHVDVNFTSKDLTNWEFQGDWWNPGLYTMFEMPDLFKMGDWWYLVFSEYSDGNKTRYRMSKSINGPWITPADDSFDGRAYYAARTAFDGERRVLFGWVPTRDEGGDPSSYLWGGTFMPLEIVQRADGTLGTKLPDSMLGAFGEAKAVEAFELSCESGKVEQVLAADAGSTYMLDADIELAGDAAGFSVKLAEDAESGLAYEFRANLREGKLEFTAAPQYPWFQVNNMGLERPLFFKGEGTHHVRLVVDDDIATIFVDDVALNARFCNKQGQGVALTVTDGTLKCANATIASL